MRARPGADRRAARIVAAASGLWSGARSASASIASTTSSSTSVGAVNRSPPWTTRWPTASIGAPAGAQRRPPRPRRPSPASASRGRAPADRPIERPGASGRAARCTRRLERRRTRVQDEDAHGCVVASVRPASSRGSPPGPRRARGRRRARRSRSSSRCWRSDAACEPRPGHPVDDVDDQVEPVEVVAHDHVERRRDRALLLVAADVEVGVVASADRSAGGSATDSRGRRRSPAGRS